MLTPQGRRRISEANIGRVVHHSDETKRRLAEGMRGKRKSPEHVAALLATRERKRELGLGKNDPSPHGTATRYKGSRTIPGCRCDACRTAWREYKRERKAARS
jgi:hypothetical protein